MKKRKSAHLLSSLLDVSSEDWQSMQEAKSQLERESVERQLKILEEFTNRYKTDNWAELFFAVVNEYTEFKVKHPKGKKERWTPLLSAMVAVDVDKRRASNKSLKASIVDLENHELWSQLIKEGKDGHAIFLKAYKDGKNKLNRHEYALATKLLEGRQWVKELKKQIKEFNKL